VDRGQLIVFEGPEGAGKTTQLQRLAGRLTSKGIDSLVVREPGGTPLGDSIREILLHSGDQISPPAEALLFMASRAELVQHEIDPALARGVVVLMDRFFLSTYAYQIEGRGLSEAAIRAANALASGGLVPDLTLVIGLPAAEGMARASARSANDRIERSGAEFHSRVGRAFARFAEPDWQNDHRECGQIVAVDGRDSVEDVHSRVVRALAQNLPQRFGMLAEAATS